MEYQGKSSMLAQAGIKQFPLEDQSIFWQNANGLAIFSDLPHPKLPAKHPQKNRKTPAKTRKHPQILKNDNFG